MRKEFFFRFFSFLFFFVFAFCSKNFSQSGGNSAFNFLKIPSSSRGASLGGSLISVNDTDISLVPDNPSLLNAGMNNNFSLNYINYIADINFIGAGYAKTIRKIGTVAAGISYFNYGKFSQTDIYDQKSGEFSAEDYSLNLSFSKKLHPQFISGGTIKSIYSSMFENKSFGIAADWAGTFLSKNNSFIVALVIKNMGSQVKTYSAGIREPMPLDVQFGFSKRIKYAPVRLQFCLKNLQEWKLADQNKISQNKWIENHESFKNIFLAGANLGLHSSAGIEFFPLKSFALRLGYDHRRRIEMRLPERGGMAGFSFGVGIKILKINCNYAWSPYHFGGASNQISISSNLAGFTKRASTKEEKDEKIH